MDYVFPHMLPNGEQEAMGFKRVSRDAALAAASQYVEGDLVVALAGGLAKYTAANLGRIGLAGRDYVQDFAKQYWLDAGEPVNLIADENEFVFSYQGATADGSSHTFAAADLLAVEQGVTRDAVFNATELCPTIRGTSGTANTIQVRLLRVYSGEVGDTNVQVVGRIERASLMS